MSPLQKNFLTTNSVPYFLLFLSRFVSRLTRSVSFVSHFSGTLRRPSFCTDSSSLLRSHRLRITLLLTYLFLLRPFSPRPWTSGSRSVVSSKRVNLRGTLEDCGNKFGGTVVTERWSVVETLYEEFEWDRSPLGRFVRCVCTGKTENEVQVDGNGSIPERGPRT